jgi:hypothetical protein
LFLAIDGHIKSDKCLVHLPEDDLPNHLYAEEFNPKGFLTTPFTGSWHDVLMVLDHRHSVPFYDPYRL